MLYFISLSPIILLFVLMIRVKLSGHLSALITLTFTVLLSLFLVPKLGIIAAEYDSVNVFRLVGWSVVEGILKAVFPIFLIIWMAIFSYNVIVQSGQIEVIKRQLVSLTDDKGILVLLMVWGFGGLLEGMAGFGTSVAIPAAILIGLGFKPAFSAVVALLGNTVATGFAALGVPVITLCNEATVGGNATIDMVCEVSSFTILQLSPLFFFIPFIILMLTDKSAWKKNILLSFWTGGVSVIVQFLCAYFLGAETPAIVGSVAAILAIIIAAKVMTGKRLTDLANYERVTFSQSLKAWSVYLIILALILLAGRMCPVINQFLKSHLVSSLHLPVINTEFRFGWISNAAFILLIGSFAGGIIQGLRCQKILVLLCKTLSSLKFTAITIISLIALASVMNNTGMISTIAAGLVAFTGGLYPFFAPMIGAVGTFVTGSDTSSNILFAKLQVNVANNLGINGSATYFGITGSESNWLLASNTTGATGGKMISPQSIAVASAACEVQDSDSKILLTTLPYAVAYVLIGGLIVYFG